MAVMQEEVDCEEMAAEQSFLFPKEAEEVAGKEKQHDGEMNGGGGGGEEKKKGESGEKGKIILGVWIHCLGCEEKVKKCLRGFPGVETVEVDSVKNRVTIKGEKADPTKVAERVRKSTGKNVELISPTPAKDKKKEEKKEEKKQPKVVEVSLKIYIHCEGCAKDLKKCIHKMPGVYTVDIDIEKDVVKVKGELEAEKLIEYVMKKAGKKAEIAKPEKKQNDKNQNQKDGEQKQKGKEDGNNNNNNSSNNSNNKKVFYDALTREQVYAPQIFSDENPNACYIM